MNIIHKKSFTIKTLLLIGISLFFASWVYSCKTHSASAEQAKAEKKQRAKFREDQRTYRKAYKRHLNKQDPATKKRMKKNIREKKKIYKVPIKDRSKKTCTK